ncbi:MAG: hypothetical protein ACI4KM_11640 [Oscillospiraceae bacterium]
MQQNSKPESDRREESYQIAKLIREGTRELERQLNIKRSRKTR